MVTGNKVQADGNLEKAKRIKIFRFFLQKCSDRLCKFKYKIDNFVLGLNKSRPKFYFIEIDQSEIFTFFTQKTSFNLTLQ